ncbi:hypothetical protein [Kitasatospora indigofera]|uniref:hypothetical protein n=1 Tax=Kitasatospora indigofera TaxID=67307 RepID=UPI0036998DAD
MPDPAETLTADVGVPDFLVDYFTQREASRAQAVAQILTGLTERELLLVKEAAVMGWVQGMRHHNLKCPGDRKILTSVIDACLSNPDLYPTITGHTNDDEDGE